MAAASAAQANSAIAEPLHPGHPIRPFGEVNPLPFRAPMAGHRHPRQTPFASRSSAPDRPASTRPSRCSRTPSRPSKSTCSTACRHRSGSCAPGVAPDHPKIKNVIKRYEKTASNEGFRFFGNVEVGRDITVAELEPRYNARPLRLRHGHRPQARDPGRGPPWLAPGDHLRRLVQRPPRLRRPHLRPDHQASSGDRQRQRRRRRRPDAGPAAPRAQVTDTADHAIEALAESGIEEIVVLGRRGPAQAAFTNPEVRELGELTDADIVIDPAGGRARPGEPCRTSSRTSATRRIAATSRSSPSSPCARPRASRSGW